MGIEFCGTWESNFVAHGIEFVAHGIEFVAHGFHKPQFLWYGFGSMLSKMVMYHKFINEGS
jgi:hypothetical protein